MEWESVIYYVKEHGITSVDEYYDMRQKDCSGGEGSSDFCMGCEQCVSLSKWLELALDHYLNGRTGHASQCVVYDDIVTGISEYNYKSFVRDQAKKVAYMKKLMRMCMKSYICKKQTLKIQRTTASKCRRIVKRSKLL